MSIGLHKDDTFAKVMVCTPASEVRKETLHVLGIVWNLGKYNVQSSKHPFTSVSCLILHASCHLSLRLMLVPTLVA